jgi:GNAT superfamily N-acetyltransferase
MKNYEVNNMEIREIGVSELSELLTLYRHLHESDDLLPETNVVEGIWKQIQTDPNLSYWGVFVDGMLVSSCALCIVPNLTRGCRPYGLIENVVTHVDHRRKGYGQAVLRVALKYTWSRNCYKVMLLTGRKNEATYQFYESIGFDRHAKQAFFVKP